jgi:hypothetical protein
LRRKGAAGCQPVRRRELDAPYMLISLRALCALCGSLPPVFRSCRLWFHPCIYLIDLHRGIDTHGNRSTVACASPRSRWNSRQPQSENETALEGRSGGLEQVESWGVKCVFVAAKVLSRTDDGLTVTGIEPILSTFLISSSKSRRGNVGSNRSGKGWFGAVHCVRVA